VERASLRRKNIQAPRHGTGALWEVRGVCAKQQWQAASAYGEWEVRTRKVLIECWTWVWGG